jgi:hypothetical protein
VAEVLGALFLLGRPRPGGCQRCTYNLTGNVTGMGQQCGQMIQSRVVA